MFYYTRGRSRTVATSKKERFVIIVNGYKPLTIYHKALLLGCCSSPISAADYTINPENIFYVNELNCLIQIKSSQI